VLDGFTITGGYSSIGGRACDASGAGMAITSASPTIVNCRFMHNAARGTPLIGAIGSVQHGLGGAIHTSGLCCPTLTGCVFKENYASSYGGALHEGSDGNAMLRDCAFERNVAGLEGGGMFNSQGNPTLTACSFRGNEAGERGGGVYHQNSDATLTNCTFRGNVANGGQGGGMCNVEGDPTLTNCAFVGNVARERCGRRACTRGHGGGMHNENSSPTLVNCAFAANAADGVCGGMFNYADSNPLLVNCVLWGNTDDHGTNSGASAQIRNDLGVAAATYTCVQDDDPDDASVYPGTGNIDDDPLFARSPDPGPDGEWDGIDDDFGNLRLLPGSPCIDAGDNTTVPPDVADLDGDGDVGEPTPFDLAGAPRFQDDPDTADTGNGTPPIVDMGAYEGPALPTLLRIIGGTEVVDGSSTLISPKAEDVGLDTFEIAVDQAVSLVGSSVVTSGGALTPAVSSLTHDGAGIHRVELTEAIPVGHWAIITLTVAGATGGESTFELRLGHLPDDINGDGEVNMCDVTAFGVLFNADPANPQRDRIDLNVDGQANLTDVTLFGQLWQGTSGHDAWQGASLPAP